MNNYFIGAKNVCIVFKPFLPIYMDNFIYHCDKLFGYVSQYKKQLGSNKIFVVFTTLIRGNEYFEKIQTDNFYIEFPKEVFINNIPNQIKVRAYYGNNEQNIILQIPNTDNIQQIHERILNIECFCNSMHAQQNNLNQQNRYQNEIEAQNNKIKIIENELTNLQFVIRQQTTVTTLLLDKLTKIQNDYDQINNNDVNNLHILKQNINEMNQYITNRIQSFEENTKQNLLEISSRQKWIEGVSQHQHQYALQTLTNLNHRLNTIEQIDNSNIEKSHFKINTSDFFEKIKNLTKNLTSLEDLNPIQFVNTEENKIINNTNINIIDDEYVDDIIVINKQQ